ncbi:MAG: hypothetical protein WCS37_07315 [Chloroflexota bacterium]|nr:hypothetical protein [Chloroflexota bacterium]
MISKLKPILARLIGLVSLLLGGVVMVFPDKMGPLLGIDHKKRAGLILLRGLALRDLLLGLYLVRASDQRSLKRGLSLRMLYDLTDFFMSVFGRGIIIQPTARKVAISIPGVVLVTYLIRRSLKEEPQGNEQFQK